MPKRKFPQLPTATLLLVLGSMGAVLAWKAQAAPQDATSLPLAPDARQSGTAPTAGPDSDHPTAPGAQAGSSTAEARLMWPVPAQVQGAPIDVTTAVPDPGLSGTMRTEGRRALVDGLSIAAIEDLREGDEVMLPLLGGLAKGRVTLVKPDESGWLRVAGSLVGGRTGSFALNTDGQEFAALVQLPEEKLAYEVASAADGRLAMVEKRLSEVVCHPLPRDQQSQAHASREADANATAAEAAPLLSSRPSATAVLYMDFDGEVVTDPLWANGATIQAQAAPFTASQITEIWNRVKEDYAPFNIDVTTDLSRYTNAPVGRRMRVIVTPTDTAAPGSGGVAYLRSFAQAGRGSFSSTIPAWAFNLTVTGAAEAISHEAGHTFGLAHDGRTSPSEGYYRGHGSGTTSWGPIMGAAYNVAISQWSKGEYANANNTEDDVAVISSSTNGVGFAADEAGNAIASAASLNAPNGAVSQAGVVTQASDADFFRFSTAGGTVSLTATPAQIRPNLDILLQIQDGAGTVLAQANPDQALNATASATVGAGTYYARVLGTGRGNPLTDGYTSYGSLGVYSLTGSIPGGTQAQAPVITSGGAASATVGTAFSYQITASNAPTSYSVTGTLPGGVTLNTGTGLISGTPTASGTFSVSIGATNAGGTGTASLTLTVTASGLTLAEALDASSLAWTTGGSAGWRGQRTVTYDGVDAAQAGAIGDNGTSWVQTTVTGPVVLYFRWKVSSQSGDALRFEVNGYSQTSISGERNWAQLGYQIPAGTYTLRWVYVKNSSGAAGSDSAWLDSVSVR